MRKKIIFVCISFILIENISFAQPGIDTTSSEEIDYIKLSAVGGITAGVFIWGYEVQNNLWWKGDKSKFHFEWKHDLAYALGEDKFGHFFFPYLIVNIYSQLFNWTGIDYDKSLLYAGALALSYETFVEIRDGYSKQWGFSWGDFSADVLGAAYPVLQNKIPILQNFNFKISFYPSDRFQEGSNRVIFDDYESTYDWLSVNVHNILPDKLKNYYPEFINLAIGHSVEKLDNNGGGNHRFYIAIDWNLEELPGNGWFWNLLKRNFNYYHLPSPAVQIYPHVIWYGIKF